MAIHLYCQKCYTSNGLDSKKCSNCKTPFGKDRRFRVAVTVKGQRSSRVVPNLTLAREVESALKSDMIREEFDITHHQAKKKAVTLNDVWAKYLPWAKGHKVTWPDDDYFYRKHIEPRFGDRALESITIFDLERMKSELKKGTTQHGRPFAPASIKHLLILVRRLFNVAIKWDLFSGPNPVKGVELPPVDNQVTEFLTDEELARLLEVLDNWPCHDSADFVKFALFTGMRRGELFKLTWENIDLDRCLVTLANPKGGKTTTLPVCDQALDVLRDRPRTSTFVFPGRGGGMRKDFKSPWLKIRAAADLPDGFRFHGLRHNFASHLVSCGIDLNVVRELLTHKDMTTTMRYAHLQPGTVREGAVKAGELLQPKQRQAPVRLVKKQPSSSG